MLLRSTVGKWRQIMPELRTIALDKIRPSPFQPRETFDKRLIQELADSMKNVDLLQPIIVRPNKGGFQIAAGERRWRAAQVAGWDEVPAIVRDLDDQQMQLYSLVENLHRLDLAPSEREQAVYNLWTKFYEPQKKKRSDLAKDLGLDESTVNRLILSHEDRTGMRSAVVRETATTEDLHITRGLEAPIRRELLEKKAKGEIAQKELEDIAATARGAPPEKQRGIVEHVTREVHKARELVQVAREEARVFSKGESARVEIRVGADENRLRRLADVSKDVRSYFTVANIEMIKNDAFRWKAVELMEKTREHCDRVLRQLQSRKWYKD